MHIFDSFTPKGGEKVVISIKGKCDYVQLKHNSQIKDGFWKSHDLNVSPASSFHSTGETMVADKILTKTQGVDVWKQSFLN